MEYRALLAIGVVVLLAAGDAADEAVKKEVANLQGTWRVISSERDGMKAPEEKIKGVTVTFQKDKLIAHQADKTIEMSYTIDPTKKPKSIDITYLDGEQKGESSQGIYSLDGDTLKICMHRTTSRPTGFETKADSQRHLIVLKREK